MTRIFKPNIPTPVNSGYQNHSLHNSELLHNPKNNNFLKVISQKNESEDKSSNNSTEMIALSLDSNKNSNASIKPRILGLINEDKFYIHEVN